MIVAPLYVVVDAEMLASYGFGVRAFAQSLRAAGVTLLQYRDKAGSPRCILENAAILREVFAGIDVTVMLNDRADLTVLAGVDGIHVGQEDLPPEDARLVIGPARVIGVSTHNEAQVRAADATSADYIAIGPVFPTGTKRNPDPVTGLEGVRRARALTAKPLVAIGGITRRNVRSVIEAGADSVAVISALFAPGETVDDVARDFLDILR